MTEAMSMVKFSSWVFRVLSKKKKTKKKTEASAQVCLILATALQSGKISSTYS